MATQPPQPGPMPAPNPAPSPSPGPSVPALPEVLKWGVAILIVGGTGNLLADHVSPAAGYGLIAIVLLGYAATHKGLDNVTKFLKDLGLPIGG